MFEFRIERSWSHIGYSIWLLDRRHDATYIADPIQLSMRKLNETEMMPAPTLILKESDAKEILESARKEFAAQRWIDKNEWDAHARIEKAMQGHIDSLKLVVDRVIGRRP